MATSRKPKVHKICQNWGTTQCWHTLYPLKGNPPKTSTRWRDVTCKRCLKFRPAK